MEGQALLEPSDDEAVAIAVFNALRTGQGGIDWAGLPLMAEWFGVADLAGLMQRLIVIKTYRKPQERGTAPE